MDAQGLMNLIRANEEAKGFDLGRWSCGTFGCLVGNFCLAHRSDPLQLITRDDGILAGRIVPSMGGVYSVDLFGAIAIRFGITKNDAEWLFGIRDIEHGWPSSIWGLFNGARRNCADRKAAINRVRKFLYYKLHKRELLYDDKGCVRDSARRAEGDLHVVRQASAMAATPAYEWAGGTPAPAGTVDDLAAEAGKMTVGGGGT